MWRPKLWILLTFWCIKSNNSFGHGFSPQVKSCSHVKIHMNNTERTRIVETKRRRRRHLQATENDSSNSILQNVGLASQPIVWISLYEVVTTGAGLPAGPFGLVGAVEGLSYVAVLGFAISGTLGKESSFVEKCSQATIGLALLALGGLVVNQGCVPNAKPILDYSAYVKVCEATPGLFGEP